MKSYLACMFIMLTLKFEEVVVVVLGRSRAKEWGPGFPRKTGSASQNGDLCF